MLAPPHSTKRVRHRKANASMERQDAVQQNINFANLGADVAAWQADFIQTIVDAHGEDQAAAAAADLKADPWLALQWFVEDMRA